MVTKITLKEQTTFKYLFLIEQGMDDDINTLYVEIYRNGNYFHIGPTPKNTTPYQFPNNILSITAKINHIIKAYVHPTYN